MNKQTNSCTFCMHPFTGLATREDGAIKVCCRSAPISNIKDESLEEAWNNEAMREVRRQVLNSERPDVCKPCFDLEDQGVESLRQRHTAGIIPEARVNLYPDALDALEDDYTMPFEFPTMEIKLNNLCNLKCRMCNPLDSTSWKDWEEVKPFYKKENNILIPIINELVDKPGQYIGPFDNSNNWWDSFEKLLPHFRRVEFAGGEPLMDPYHYKILDKLAEYGDQIELKYATNGTTLGIKGGRTIHDYWPKFKSIAVNVSIDGIGPSYEYIRGNGDWDKLIENIKIIKEFPNITRVVGAVAVQVSNILVLDKMIEYFLDELGIVFYTNMVNYPKPLCPQVLPLELKQQAIARLEAVKDLVPNFKYVKETPILLDITLAQIQGVINYLKANDQSERWIDCIEFNARLDKTRNQNFLATNPEFKPYV